ncbi:hypothetical protein B0T16DRAFT_502927 [Cercophora newfieldiana]|uniref:Uncharacterized protein n=1 Tax=Cercophora newfieldiana TaxID=92897 RepID=A0AA39YTN0_9PEZI|nr:hypothetical protein B0T16DRAFT_502927 [Cercophora newfieldiana]
MAGIVHLVSQLSPTTIGQLQTLLENLRSFSIYSDSDGAWYSKAGISGRHRFLVEFITDNSARNDKLAFARCIAAFEAVGRGKHGEYHAALEELRDAVYFVLVGRRLRDAFDRRYGRCASKLFIEFEKVKEKNPDAHTISLVVMGKILAKATEDCVDYVGVQDFLKTLIHLATTDEPDGSFLEKHPDWCMMTANIIRFTGYIRQGETSQDSPISVGKVSMNQALKRLRQAVLDHAPSEPDQTMTIHSTREQNRVFVIVIFRRLLEELGLRTVREKFGNNQELIAKHGSSKSENWRLFCNFITRGPIHEALGGLPLPHREIYMAIIKNMYRPLAALSQGFDGPVERRFPSSVEIEAADLDLAWPWGARYSNGAYVRNSHLLKYGVSRDALEAAMVEVLKMLKPAVGEGKVNWVEELDRHIDRGAVRAQGLKFI